MGQRLQSFDVPPGLAVSPSYDELGELFVGPVYRERFGPAGTGRAFHVSVYPSFRDYVGYELLRDCRDIEGDRWFLSRRTWCRVHAASGTQADSSFAVVASSMAEPWLAALRSFHVPLNYLAPGGLDGTTYELALGHYPASFRLRWWGEGPNEWAPLTSWVRAFLEEVRALDGWGPPPLVTDRDGIVSAWALFPPTGARATELKALRDLVPSVTDIPLTELRRRGCSPEGMPVGEMPLRLARDLQAKASALGLRVELRPKACE